MMLIKFYFFLLIFVDKICSKVLKFVPQSTPQNDIEPLHWALIVAGSNGWENYRHQADACHAYQIMKKHGIQDDQIILMMYDDIANNSMNPSKGKVINHPKGPNVYDGVLVDYRGKDVTPENFLAILRGDAERMKHIGSGKVINSGPKDHIFVNFVDHGAPGLVAFPESELYAKDLIKTIESMYKAQKYYQMLFYMEACESGSMFQSLLPNNINVYATTASNSEESSYACYFDDQLQTYLGDVYSVMWMEDSDKENLLIETLLKQFLIVRNATNTSHVMQFGDKNLSLESVASFQASSDYVYEEPSVILPKVLLEPVPSEDVPLAILYRKLDLNKDPYTDLLIKKQIKELIKNRDRINDIMSSIVKTATKDSQHYRDVLNHMPLKHQQLTQHDCYKSSVKHYDAICADISTDGYARKSLRQLLNLCEVGVPNDLILDSITSTCSS